MADEIKLITFADSNVTATDDAYVYELATGQGGILNGCVVTIKNASELHITGGNGVLCGRKFTIYDSDINVTLSASGTLNGRLYIHMDLSNASEPIKLMVETGATLTPVQQDADVNATNGIYEINLVTFTVSTSTIADLVDVAVKAYPRTVLNTVEDCVASTNPGDIAGASVISTLNSNIESKQDKTWTEFGNNNTGTIPTNANEIILIASYSNSGNVNWSYTFKLPVNSFIYGKRYFDGYGYSSNQNMVQITINSGGVVSLTGFYVDNASVVSSAVLKMYYR